MTKEDLMQISELIDQKLAESEERTRGYMVESEERTRGYIAESEERTRGYMNVLIESMIQPQFNLLAEGQADIQEKLVPRSRIDELEEEVKFMRLMYRQMAEDIAKLKKAQ